MNRNFFIRLAFASHRVADTLQDEEQMKLEIKNSANAILTDLLLFSEKDIVPKEKKKQLGAQIPGKIDVLLSHLSRAKQEGLVNPENFSLLEVEYGKIKDLLQIFYEFEEPTGASPVKEFYGASAKEKPVPVEKNQGGGEIRSSQERLELSERQRRILELLKAKQKVQVWELQKVLPQVTKRTLRRDLDDLLQRDFIQRKGEWNAVFYELKEKGTVV